MNAQAPAEIIFLAGLWGGDTPDILEWIPGELKKRGVPFRVVPPREKVTIQQAGEVADAWIRANVSPEVRVHLVGHSMGGLIGRYLCSHVWDTRSYEIASLTTCATPHLGTPLAALDSGLARFVHPAIEQMSYEGVRRFNESGSPDFSPPHPLVQCYSWGASISSLWSAGDWQTAFLWHRLSQTLRKERQDTRNDSVVPLFSQAFGRYLGTMAVNHSYYSVRTSFKNPDVITFYETHFKFVEANYVDPAEALRLFTA